MCGGRPGRRTKSTTASVAPALGWCCKEHTFYQPINLGAARHRPAATPGILATLPEEAYRKGLAQRLAVRTQGALRPSSARR